MQEHPGDKSACRMGGDSLWLPVVSVVCSFGATTLLIGRNYQLVKQNRGPAIADSVNSPLLPDASGQVIHSRGFKFFWLACLTSGAQVAVPLCLTFLLPHAQQGLSLIQAVTLIFGWAAALLLAPLEERKGAGFPGPILPWWWAIAAGTSFASAWQLHDRWRTELVACVTSGALALLLLLVQVVSASQSGGPKVDIHANAYDRASLLSRLTFWYILDLLKLGYKRPLQPADVPPLPKFDDPEPPTNRFQVEWTKERAKPKPSLLRALVRVYGGRVAFQAIPCFLAEVGSLACPLLLQRVLTYLTANPGKGSPATWRALQYAFAFFAFTMMRSVGTHTMWMQLMQVSIQCKYTLIAALYGKVLKMAPAGKGKHTAGKVQNLVASDVDAITKNVLPYVQWWTVSMVRRPPCTPEGLLW